MRLTGTALVLAAAAALLTAAPSEAAFGSKNKTQQAKAAKTGKQPYKTDPCKFVDCPPLNPQLSVKHDLMVGQKGTATLTLTNKCKAENVLAQIVVPAGIKILSTASKSSGVQATVGALSASTGGNVIWKNLPVQKSYKFLVRYEVTNCADHQAIWSAGAVLVNPNTAIPGCPQPAGTATSLIARRTSKKGAADATCAPTPAPTANADPHYVVAYENAICEDSALANGVGAGGPDACYAACLTANSGDPTFFSYYTGVGGPLCFCQPADEGCVPIENMYSDTYFGKEPDPPSPSPTPTPYDTCYSDYSYAGPNVGELTGLTLQQCADVCDENQQCGLFSFNSGICRLYDYGTNEIEAAPGFTTYTLYDRPCACNGFTCSADTDCTCPGYANCVNAKCARSCKGKPCTDNNQCNCNPDEPMVCLYWPGDADHLTCQDNCYNAPCDMAQPDWPSQCCKFAPICWYGSCDIACFNGEALADMADGSRKPVHALRKGDVVKTGLSNNDTAVVRAVVEFLVGDDAEMRPVVEVSPGFFIDEDHPILGRNASVYMRPKWDFPTLERRFDRMYNLVLEDGAFLVSLQGTPVVTMREGPVGVFLLDHPRKWGWYKEVAESAGFAEGHVVIEGGLKSFRETWGVEEPDYDQLWKEGTWFASASA